jgi:dextranase
MTLNIWPPQIGQISVVGKEFANKQVLHFINFTSATHLNWRDANGTQVPPNTITDAAINFTSTKLVRQVWLASPDVNGGVAHSIAFTQSGNMVSFTLPSLKYWDMVVVEYQ